MPERADAIMERERRTTSVVKNDIPEAIKLREDAIMDIVE